MKINGMSYHLRPMPPLSDGVGLIFSYAVGGTAGGSRTRNQSHPIICRWIWRLPVPSIAGTIEKNGSLPHILILDEVLSVGDGAFRKKSEAKMREIIAGGATTILVSHSLA